MKFSEVASWNNSINSRAQRKRKYVNINIYENIIRYWLTEQCLHFLMKHSHIPIFLKPNQQNLTCLHIPPLKRPHLLSNHMKTKANPSCLELQTSNSSALQFIIFSNKNWNSPLKSIAKIEIPHLEKLC